MVDPEEEDLIMSLILQQHCQDFQLIEDILEEQHKKTMKFPITTFFHRASLKNIIQIMIDFKLTRIQRPKQEKKQRLSVSQIEEKVKEKEFEKLIKSKSGNGGAQVGDEKRKTANQGTHLFRKFIKIWTKTLNIFKPK